MHSLVVLPGDGIGQEVTEEAVKVLKIISKYTTIQFDIIYECAGGASIDAYGVPMRDKTLSNCRKAGIVLLGAIGGTKWDKLPLEMRPEQAILTLRKGLNVFTNLRPVKVFDNLTDVSSLKREIVQGVDMLIVRELTGGLYFGKPRSIKSCRSGERAVDTMVYRTYEIERIAHSAFIMARARKKKLTMVDKSNVLATSRLWLKTVSRVSENYPEITMEHMYVDNCAMQIVRNPRQFDVILTENTFGDILSDEASILAGSLGMIPSASIGDKCALYEPIHGSAPDIAGQGKANPIGAILSVGLMLQYSFNQGILAKYIEKAVENVLAEGYRTPDIAAPGTVTVPTSVLGDKIKKEVRRIIQ